MAIEYLDSGSVFHTTATSTFTINTPSGTAQNDIFVLVVTTRSEHVITNKPDGPVPWQAFTDREDGVTVSIIVHPVLGAPPSSLSISFNAAETGGIAWAQFRGVDVANPVDVFSGTVRAVGNSILVPNTSTVTNNAYVLGGVTVSSGSRVVTLAPGWLTQVQHGERIGHIAMKGVQATAGPTGNAPFDISGASIWGYAWQMGLRADASGGEPVPLGTLMYSWVGIPDVNAIRVSARTTSTTTARLVLSTSVELVAPIFSASAVPDGAGWSKFVVGNLASDTDYYYAIEMTDSNEEVSISPTQGPVRTQPAPGTPKSFQFAFGSCLDSNSSNSRAFNNAISHDPDFFFHLGDFHYADATSTNVNIHRGHLENQIATNAGLRNLLASIPTWYTPSDHDAGGGNGSLPGAWTSANMAAYRQIVPHLNTPDMSSTYGSFVVGRVRFVITDQRYPRTASKMLGDSQTAWFKNEMRKPEPMKIWVQDAPWLMNDPPTSPNNGGDKWSDYPAEHRALGDWIANNAVGQVVSIHGDMHALSADDGSNNLWGGFPVVGAAPFDRNSSVKGGPYSDGIYPPTPQTQFQQQHGMIEIVDDGGETITLTYRGYGSDNTQRLSLSVVAPSEVDLGVRYFVLMPDGTEVPATIEGVLMPNGSVTPVDLSVLTN